MKSNETGFKRILKAFEYSCDGFKSVFKREPSFRQELILSLLAGCAIVVLPVAGSVKALLAGSLFFILFAELINTAIEIVVDRISEERHPLSKQAKDIGSLLVLLSFINAVIMWGCVLSDLI